MTFAEALRLLEALERHDVAYVIVGSMAMAAQGVVRATRDIDRFVSLEESNVTRLKAALKEVFADSAIEDISASGLAGDYPAVQYVPPVADCWIDVIARLGNAFRLDDVESETLRIGSVTVRVAAPGMLYRMKKDTVRPQDRADAQVLKERFNLEDD